MTDAIDAAAPTTERPRRKGNPEGLAKARAAKAAKRAAEEGRAASDERSGVRPTSGPPEPPQDIPRGRPSRELMERRAREQRLDVMDGSEDYNLIVTVPLDRENFTYRWELDEPGVLERRYQNYWERVDGQEPYHAYTDGLRPVNFVLIQKYRPWYVEDQRARHERDRSVMEQIKRGEALDSFGQHEDGRPAQYTHDSRGRAIEVSVTRGGPPR